MLAEKSLKILRYLGNSDELQKKTEQIPEIISNVLRYLETENIKHITMHTIGDRFFLIIGEHHGTPEKQLSTIKHVKTHLIYL